MPNLTRRFVDSIEAPARGQVFYRDDKLPGFALRVTPGSKSYIVEGRVHGTATKRRITIARHYKLTPELARRAAQQVIALMALGVDPVADKAKLAAESVTVGEVRDKYIAIRPMSRYGIRYYTQLFDRCLGDWLEKPLNKITKDMVERKHKELTKTTRFGTPGKAQANAAMQALNTLFRFAIEYYEGPDGAPIIRRNPVRCLSQNKQWHEIRRRESIVSDEDLAVWYDALNVVRPKVRDYLLFILFTGMRRMEAAQIKFEFVDWELELLNVPSAICKNRRGYRLPLSPFLMEIVRRRQVCAGSSEYLFPGRRGHLRHPYLERLQNFTTFSWTVHDLRRTFITAAEKVGVPHAIIKRLVNHVSGRDVTDGYIILGVEDLRESMNRISDHLLSLTGENPG